MSGGAISVGSGAIRADVPEAVNWILALAILVTPRDLTFWSTCRSKRPGKHQRIFARSVRPNEVSRTAPGFREPRCGIEGKGGRV